MNNVLLKENKKVNKNNCYFTKKCTPFSAKEEKAIFQELKRNHNDKQLRNKIVIRNKGLVLSVASRLKYLYSKTGFSFKDVCQEGNIGLMTAVKKFNPQKGCKFSTYAIYWIIQAMIRAVYNGKDIIRIPFYLSEKLYKYNKVKEKLEKNLKREPSLAEVMEESGLKKEDVEQIEKIKRERMISLDSFVKNAPGQKEPVGEGTRLIELLEKKGTHSISEKVEQDELKREIDAAFLLYLTKRETKILKMRMGMTEDNGRYTLAQIGKIFNLTRERVRQLEGKALRKLRNSKASVILKDFLK